MKNDEYKVKYICKSKGLPERYFTSIQELDECDNSLDRAIETLIMDVSSDDDFSLHLVFGKATIEDLVRTFDGFPLPTPINVYGEVKGKKKHINELMADVDYHLRRYSHSRIHSFLSYSGVLFTLCLMAALFWGYYYIFGVPKTYSIPLFGIDRQPYNTSTFWRSVLPYVQLCIFTFFYAICIRKPISRLFPRVKFVMGDNLDLVQQKHILKERIVWDVIIVCIINLVFLLVNYICFG